MAPAPTFRRKSQFTFKVNSIHLRRPFAAVSNWPRSEKSATWKLLLDSSWIRAEIKLLAGLVHEAFQVHRLARLKFDSRKLIDSFAIEQSLFVKCSKFCFSISALAL